MVAWATEAYAKSMEELWQHRRRAVLHALLYRFVVETEKRDEFLSWAAKDMGLDKPMDLTKVDALIEAIGAHGQLPQ